jgi:hypothetical protein
MTTSTSASTKANEKSGDMVTTGNKRDNTSPGGAPAKKAPEAEPGTKIVQIMGWLEHTIVIERGKKLTVHASDGMMEKMNELRSVMHALIGENNRLRGRLAGKGESMKDTLTTFLAKLGEKTSEIDVLKAENQELKDKNLALVKGKQSAMPSVAVEKTVSYAQVTKDKPANKPSQKDKKKVLEKRRETRSGTSFVAEVPDDKTIANVKTDLWQTVKNKFPNPRAKTIISGKKLIIIPDDKDMLEMLNTITNLKTVGPRQPRIIIYDVDSELSEIEIADGLLQQNPELGLTEDEIKKLGLKDCSMVHWVIETPANILSKLENKSVYLGMTRCRVKIYKSTTQCYRCQRYGHTSLKCNNEKPVCRHYAVAHDSRE